MKSLLILAALLLSSCANTPEIKGVFIDGECKPLPDELLIIKQVLLGDVEAELKNIYRNGMPDLIANEFESLKKELTKGGLLYEISSDEKSWQSLSGSLGYGVVNKSCLVSYLQLIVS